MAIVIVATLRPIPEHRAEVVTAIEKAMPVIHAEDAGCELYALHEGADRLVFIEKWTTEQDIGAHAATEVFAELTAALEGKLLEPMDVQVLSPHPVGSEVQGAL